MHTIVIGAGAWGLPTATRIAEQGHRVTLIDRWGPGNPLSSSPGPSRIWRLSDHRPDRVELSVKGLEAMARSEHAAGKQLYTRSGMLWRHEASNDAVWDALTEVGDDAQRVPADRVGDFFLGLRPTASDAVWSPTAGTVLADRVIRSELHRFQQAGGELLTGKHVARVHPSDTTPTVEFVDGSTRESDTVVIAAGMGAKALLDPLVPTPLPFVTRLEQVVHFGDATSLSITDQLPCVFDGATDVEPGMYGMATPGIGFKFGLDIPIRDFQLDDPDRTPSPERTEVMRQRIERDFQAFPARVVDAACCNWTDSADGEFVLDRLPGNIVVGAGDSGEGFKFTALVGEILCALTLGTTPPVSVTQFSIERFAHNPALQPDQSGQSFSHRRFGEH